MMTDLSIRCAGNVGPEKLEVHGLIAGCGTINNGIGVSFGSTGGFVLDFADLERVVEAGKALREEWKTEKGVEFPQGQTRTATKCFHVSGPLRSCIVTATSDSVALLIANEFTDQGFEAAKEIPFLYSDSEGVRVLVETKPMSEPPTSLDHGL